MAAAAAADWAPTQAGVEQILLLLRESIEPGTDQRLVRFAD